MQLIKEYNLLGMFHCRKYQYHEYKICVELNMETGEKYISVKSDDLDFPEINVSGGECQMDFPIMSYTLKDVDRLIENIKIAKKLMRKIEENFDTI